MGLTGKVGLMKRFFAATSITALGFAALALAQGTSVDDIINKLQATQKNVKDFRAKISGSAEQDDQKVKFEVNVAGITDKKLTRVEFLAPDALADNILIIDNTNLFNYQFITNQVTISKSSSDTEVAGFNFNPSQLADFDQTFPRAELNFAPVKTETTPAGKAYLLDITPKKKGAFDWARMKLWVIDGTWRAYRLQALNDKNVVDYDITIPEWKTNQGLKTTDLCKLPKDAETIRKGTLKKISCEVK
jgi:outer membrane lipoprotein-sorting protein